MSDTPPPSTPKAARAPPGALTVTLVYASLAALWILWSDWLLDHVVGDSVLLIQISVLKGWAFVAVTSALLYGLMRSGNGTAGEGRPAPVPVGVDAAAKSPPLLPLVLIALGIVLLTGAAIYNVFRAERMREAARVEAVADLRAELVGNWLGDMKAQAAYISSSASIAEAFRGWHGRDDDAAARELLGQLVEFRRSGDYQSVRVLDAKGDTVLAENGVQDATSPELRRAAMQAMATGAPVHAGFIAPAVAEGGTYPTFAIVAPLVANGHSAQAAVVFRVDPEKLLRPLLRAWPIPSASGKTRIVTREGDRAFDRADGQSLPLATPELLAGRVILGDAPEGVAFDANDFNGLAVLGVVRRIAGTDWYLAAQVDRTEFLARATQEANWILAAGVLALFLMGVVARHWQEREELRVAQIQKAEHAASLNALRLLDAIAESSTDAIYAKDRVGRYLLCNRALALTLGKTRAAVIGHDDRLLFPAAEAAEIMRNDARAMQEGGTRTYEETLSTLAGKATFLATKGPLRDADGTLQGVFGISRDVTSRVRAETVMRESAQRYESLFINMQSGFAHCRMIFDGDEPIDWEYLAVNPAFERMMGLRDIVGVYAGAATHGLFAGNPELLEYLGGVAMHRTPANFEIQVLAVGAWLSVSAYCPAEGEFVATFENITERKRAESSLGASEERLRIFVEHAPAAIAMLDREMCYLAHSRRYLADYRIAESNVIGRSHYDVFPEIPDRWKEVHRRCLAGAVESVDEDPFVRSDGSVDLVKWEMRPWYDDKGAVGGLLLFSELVTERKRAEMALRENRKRLEFALAAARMGVWEWNFATGEMYWSPEVWPIFGMEQPAVPNGGMSFARFMASVHPEDAERVAAITQAAITSGSRHSVEFRIRLPDGSERWVFSAGQAEHAPDGTPVRGFGVIGDVEIRKRAELAVRESEANYRSMVSALSEGVVVFDPDGSVRECNASAEHILGLTRDEMIRNRGTLATWHPVREDGTPIPPEELPVAVTLATGKPQRDIVLGEVRTDGRMGWLLVNSEPILEPDSRRLTGAIVSFIDITERFAREQQLRKLSLAVEQSPESIVITDLMGSIEYVNESFTRVSGYSREEVAGRNPRVLQSGETPATTYSSMWQALADGVDWQGEFVNQRKNGETYTELARVSPVRDLSGKVTNYVAIKEDVTARKQLEHELDVHRNHLEDLVAERTRELQSAHRALVDAERFAELVADSIPGGVAYWDRDLRCRFANRSYLAWFGVSHERWQGQRFADLLSESVFRKNQQHIEDVLQGAPQLFERILETESGPTRVVNVHYAPDSREDGVHGFFVLVTDITASKQYELNLRQLNEALTLARDKADDANLAKSAFLANMSHEIRTPMNAIIGLTHLLRRDTRDPAQLDRLAKVSTATNHLLQVINDVLDLSKIEAGKLRFEVADFLVDTLLSHTLQLVAERAHAKGLELVLDIEEFPSVLRGDTTRLSQALLNLLANAVKFTEKGSIVVRVELLEDSDDGQLVRFSVRDTGIGIAEDNLGSLFSAFEQTDSSMTRRFGGTGLGLAITRQLAYLMGGSVGVRSEEGVGSTFWFTARLARPEHGAEPVGDSPLQGLRALLVDDSPDACNAISAMLVGMGLCVDTVSTGDDAVTKVDKAAATGDPYAVVLLDWPMPGSGSAEIVRLLRKRDQAVPLVMLSAVDAFELRMDPLFAATTIVDKPVIPSRLREALAILQRAAGRTAPPAAFAQQDEALLRSLHAGARVLLAEDNIVNQAVAVELLQSVGLVVELAGSGTEAVTMARDGRYDLILMDLQMPEMDGLDATRAIRALPEGRDVPILATTASVFSEDRQLCFSAGMNDHIAKPINPAVLFAALLKWLPQGQSLPPAADAGSGLDTDTGQRLTATQEDLAAPDSAGERASVADTGEMLAAFDRLDALLSAADFDAGFAFRDTAPLLRAAFGSKLLDIEAPLLRFDYPAALAALRALRGRSGDDTSRSAEEGPAKEYPGPARPLGTRSG